MLDRADLVPARSLVTDHYYPFNGSEGPDKSTTTAPSTKVQRGSSQKASTLQLDFIPTDERQKRATHGFPCVSTPAGAYGVEGHGEPGTVFTRNGAAMNAGELARIIANDPHFRPGMRVYLMCCETGKGRRPIAQKLADELGSEVVAPTEKLWPLRSGRYFVAQATGGKGAFASKDAPRADHSRPGEMKVFRPDGAPATSSEKFADAGPLVASADLPNNQLSQAASKKEALKKSPFLRPGARAASRLAAMY